MKIAITGGTGFVGRHLARHLLARGHQVVLIARGLDTSDPALLSLKNVKWHPMGLADEHHLAYALRGCEAVAHCAGIHRETLKQTFQQVHVEGTRMLVRAARTVGVQKILFTSYLRARSGCGSPYLESKWQAEEEIRQSRIPYTILKPGMIFGPGDHMLAQTARALTRYPAFGIMGLNFKGMLSPMIRPVAIEDFIRLMEASLVSDGLKNGLKNRTISVLGPEELSLLEMVYRVARVVGKDPLYVHMPIGCFKLLAAWSEWYSSHSGASPLVSQAQIRMLAEGMTQPLPDASDPIPPELLPMLTLTPEQIRYGLSLPQLQTETLTPDSLPLTLSDQAPDRAVVNSGL